MSRPILRAKINVFVRIDGSIGRRRSCVREEVRERYWRPFHNDIFKSNLPVSLCNWLCLVGCPRDAEDLLRDKALGCFLIRLSDKTIGYILSYKWGRSRPSSMAPAASLCLSDSRVSTPPKGPQPLPPFCHHPESGRAVRHSGRLSELRQPARADRELQGQPHPALRRVPDLQLPAGETAVTFAPDLWHPAEWSQTSLKSV